MLELSHVGEILISEILTRSLEARQVLRSAGCAISENLVIVPEVRPNNCGPLAFDGTHRIDVAVLDLDTRICFPFEAKLGLDRLSKNEFSKRFLNQCGTSHKDTRVRGSMISILERMLPRTTSIAVSRMFDRREPSDRPRAAPQQLWPSSL